MEYANVVFLERDRIYPAIRQKAVGIGEVDRVMVGGVLAKTDKILLFWK